MAFNPRVELESPGAATDRELGRYEASLSQEIEWAGQRGLRIDAAESALREAAQSVRNAARLTVAEASAAYYAATAANRRLALAEEIFAGARTDQFPPAFNVWVLAPVGR